MFVRREKRLSGRGRDFAERHVQRTSGFVEFGGARLVSIVTFNRPKVTLLASDMPVAPSTMRHINTARLAGINIFALRAGLGHREIRLASVLLAPYVRVATGMGSAKAGEVKRNNRAFPSRSGARTHPVAVGPGQWGLRTATVIVAGRPKLPFSSNSERTQAGGSGWPQATSLPVSVPKARCHWHWQWLS
jgi:hypothetical protein